MGFYKLLHLKNTPKSV